MRAKAAHFTQIMMTLVFATVISACGSPAPTVTPTTTTPPPDPTRPPAEIRWEPYQGIQLPIGAQDGPAKPTPVAIGYSHSPQGAALAAINHTIRLSLAPDGSWPQIANLTLITGPAKDSWVLARAQISITAPADPATAPRISAYKIAAYTPDRSDVTIFTTYPDASIASTTRSVVWASNDWRLQLPDPDSQEPTIQAIDFIPFDAIPLASPN
ncbi:hypothetical protein [Nocardia crassostreae]|uniref:hypothetical protein n=1 Tax=Nocardia crassostreae TaxID=53428 RepID=UPI000B26DA0C|nr:hypothetical protein [Nocardia crassostreae]